MTDNLESTPRQAALWEKTAVPAIGVWLLVSPAILSQRAEVYVSVGAGMLVIALGFATLRKDRLWAEWAIIACGVVMAALPWFPGQATAGGINLALCGLLILVPASWRIHDIRALKDAGGPAAPLATRLADSVRDDERRVA